MEFLNPRCGIEGGETIPQWGISIARGTGRTALIPRRAPGAFEEYQMEILLWIVLAAAVVGVALYVANNDPFGIFPK